MESKIDLSAEPSLYAKIVDGDFMKFRCPECGNELKTEVPVHLYDKPAGVDLQFLPELERSNFLSGNIKPIAVRVAIGYPELVEKIVIAGAKLDDRIIEIIKFRMLEKAERNDIRIYLSSIENGTLIFHIHGLKPDQLGVSRIPENTYKKIETELDGLLENDDIKLFTEGPYVSVSRIYLED